jgi:hypothetical protein
MAKCWNPPLKETPVLRGGPLKCPVPLTYATGQGLGSKTPGVWFDGIRLMDDSNWPRPSIENWLLGSSSMGGERP